MKEQGHTLEIRRFDDDGDVEFEVLHPESCPTITRPTHLQIRPNLHGTVGEFDCATGWIVRENGVEDIRGWRDLPEGKYPIAVELEPGDWQGAMDAFLVLDPKEER